MSGPLRFNVRYSAMHSLGPDDNVEVNIWPIDEEIEIDAGATALVLVDTWNNHPIRSHRDSTAEVMRTRIAPLLPHLRAAGIPLIYAPSPDVAPRYPQWRERFGGRDVPVVVKPAWPPTELRSRTREYARYARKPGETPPEYDGPYPAWWRWDAIADVIAPQPDDHVVSTGQELHELLAERRVLFPLYVGFATNICVLHRDYGILAMGARGYLPILLRDCTVGIETRDTLPGMVTTTAAIHEVERRYYSAESEDVIRACEALLED